MSGYINTLEQFRKERANRTTDDINPFKNRKGKLPAVPVSIWKNNKGGWETDTLFYETCTIQDRRLVGEEKEALRSLLLIETKLKAPYSLGEDDLYITWEGQKYCFPSLKRLFLESDVLPGFEYDWTKEHLGGWEHWQAMRKRNVLSDIFLSWDKEKLIQIKSRGMNNILSISANKSHKDMFQANKFLTTKGYDVENVDKKKIAKVNKEIKEEVDEDMEKLGLLRIVK